MRKSIKAYVAGFLTCLMIISTVAWAATGGSVMREVSYGIRVVVDGVEQNFAEDMRPFISGGRTFLPVRGIAEALGIPVEWDGETSTVYIGYRPAQLSARTDLVVAAVNMPVSLDPVISNDGASALVNGQIYCTLVILDYDTMEILPSLAIAWDMPDAQTVNMELRRDVMFHNGDPLTAHDVAFSLGRAANSAEAVHFAGMIDSVTVHDNYSFTIHLDIPFAPILRHLASPMMGIVSANDSIRLYERPIGTGPFMFFGHSDDMVLLERNPYYWGSAPQVESLIFIIEGDPHLRLAMVEAGVADVAMAISPMDVSIAEASQFMELLRGPVPGVDYIGFNLAKEPWNNPLVTQAMNYLLDSQTFIDVVFDGVGRPAAFPMSDMPWGYAEITPFDQDLERARELLAEAGYSDGFGRPIEFWVNNIQRLQIAELVQFALAPLSIDVEIHVMEWPALLHCTAIGEHDMYISGWIGLTGDADYSLFPLFHSSNLGEAGNRTHTANPELDRLLEAGRIEQDPVRRAAIYEEVFQMLRQHPPMVPIRQLENLVTVSSDLRGLTLSPSGNHRFYSVYFD